jgi:RNA polymerase sigma factor (sigma-70 family)
MARNWARTTTGALSRLVEPPAGPDLDDRDLLQRFVTRRDEAAFTLLMERHGPMVLGVCRRVLRDAHEADDAFQATFFVLVHKARSIGRPERLGPWLHGVAYRTAARARDQARRRARTRETAPALDGDPATQAEGAELRQLLDEELARLARKLRAPLVLCYLEGKTTDEVARLLGCPRGTVLSRLARGRDRLRDRLIRRGFSSSLWAPALVSVQKSASALVPAKMAEKTIKAAALTAAGKAANDAMSAPAAALTRGELRAMFLSKVKLVASVVLALSLGVAACIVGARWALADPPAAAAKDKEPTDEERILGTWDLVAFEEGGQKAPDEKIKEVTWTFAAQGKLVAKQGLMEQEFVYELDTSKRPTQISLTTKGHTGLGIYKFEKDRLTICAPRVGNDPPTEFVSKEGTLLVLVVLKRAK